MNEETQQKHILLVEDDANLGSVLTEFLEIKNYIVTLCTDGEAGRKEYERSKSAGTLYDMLILDVMMPKLDGFSLAEMIRQDNPTVPIIFLTAKSMKEDRLEGFRLGADDYITKPFSIEELIARVQAIFRRVQTPKSAENVAIPERTSTINSAHIYRIGQFIFNHNDFSLSNDGEIKHLTSREADLLKLFAENMGNVVRREVALKQIWGDDSWFNGRSMDVFITKLRKYLKADPTVEIVTVHGTGYKLIIN